MTKKPTAVKPHRWDETFEVSFRQYYRDAFGEAVSLIRSLEKEYGKAKIHEFLKKRVSENTTEAVKKQMSEEGITSETFEEFKERQDDMWQSDRVRFTHSCEKIIDTKDTLEYRVTECIWAETFRGLNATDIGFCMLCFGDYASAEARSPNLKLHRKKTIMEGHEYCDFVYKWTE